MRLEEILVHLDTDSRPFQWPHGSVLRKLERRAGELVAKQVVLRDVALEVAAVVDGSEEMDARGHVEARHRGVRMDLELVRGSHRGDTQALGDAAALREVRSEERRVGKEWRWRWGVYQCS